jgi:4-azaleucine resistance transporter AzlC
MGTDASTQPPQRSPLVDGAAAAWPICFGYLPIGIAFGVLAQKAGLSLTQIGLMSLLVFAGSSQFIAVSLMASGATTAAIVATTFMVNLRHLLMSSALAVYLGAASRAKLSLFAYGVTDESFAVNAVRFRDGGWDVERGLALNHTANLAWIGASLAGGLGGRFIPAHALGIDYALIAMFICLLVFQLKGRVYAVTAGIAGILAVALSLILPGNTHIVLASVLGAALGAVIRRRARRQG